MTPKPLKDKIIQANYVANIWEDENEETHTVEHYNKPKPIELAKIEDLKSAIQHFQAGLKKEKKLADKNISDTAECLSYCNAIQFALDQLRKSFADVFEEEAGKR